MNGFHVIIRDHKLSLYKCLKPEPLHKFRLQQIDVKTIHEEDLKNLYPIFGVVLDNNCKIDDCGFSGWLFPWLFWCWFVHADHCSDLATGRNSFDAETLKVQRSIRSPLLSTCQVANIPTRR